MIHRTADLYFELAVSQPKMEIYKGEVIKEFPYSLSHSSNKYLHGFRLWGYCQGKASNVPVGMSIQ